MKNIYEDFYNLLVVNEDLQAALEAAESRITDLELELDEMSEEKLIIDQYELDI